MRVNINQLNKISHFEKNTKQNIIPFVTGGLITVIIFYFLSFLELKNILCVDYDPVNHSNFIISIYE